MRIHHQILLLLYLLCSCSTVVLGDSFRCGRQLVSTGDSSGELLRVCGEPYHKDKGRSRLDVDGINRDVSVERWHYKRSSRSLEHIIILYKGTVHDVIVGNR
ncbi:DUF2845 domain-containing protein [Pseudomonadota bacterium]